MNPNTMDAKANDCRRAPSRVASNSGGVVPTVSHGWLAAKLPLWVVIWYCMRVSPMVAGRLTAHSSPPSDSMSAA